MKTVAKIVGYGLLGLGAFFIGLCLIGVVVIIALW